jgi:acylphosphatase
MKHVNITVTGKVQGVWYRSSAKAKAEELGLKGFVRNHEDGSVYIEAEGTAEKLFQFAMWCHYGPQGARVDEVKTVEAVLMGFDCFRIER